MKKLIAALLALVMVFSLAACGEKPDDTQTPDDNGSVVTPTEEKNEAQGFDSEETQAQPPVTGGLTVEALRKHPETPADQFIYSECLDQDGLRIDQYIGTDDIVVVPAEIDGRPVVAIAVVCFGNDSIVRGIVIPESVKEMEEVFTNNGNLEIIIAEGLETLGYGLFVFCSNLREVVLGDNVTAIRQSVFNGCYALEKVNIPATLTEMTEAEAFSTFNGLTNLTIYCEAGSYIEQIAAQFGIPCVNE